MRKSIEKSRRDFIGNSIKTSVALSVGLAGFGEFLQSCGSSINSASLHKFHTGFSQSSLPYNFSSLESVLDAKTMEIHYTKHAAGYSKNLEAAMKSASLNMTTPVEEILGKIENYSAAMRNNGGGHYNHELFWQNMQAPTVNNLPIGKLNSAINKTFGSFQNFQTQFAEAAKTRFGSGWAWLYLDKFKTLKISSTPNQDNPLMSNAAYQGFPILGIDVWEHAYYLKYQNKRQDYINNWWQVVNWINAEKRFNSAV